MKGSRKLTAVFTVLLLVAKMLAYITSPLWLDSLKPKDNNTTTNSTDLVPNCSNEREKRTTSNTANSSPLVKVIKMNEGDQSESLYKGPDDNNSSFGAIKNNKIGRTKAIPQNSEVADCKELESSTNATSNTDQDEIQQTDPLVLVLLQAFIPTVVFGMVLIVTVLCCPSCLGPIDRFYPHGILVLTGLAQAVSALLVNYAMSGTRTAPYLQALLTNFFIPIQIVVRLAILRRFPTLRKGMCAAAVVLAEVICLLPNMVPCLQSTEDHQQQGGATGPGAFLWPLCFVLGHVPTAVCNTLVEKSVKAEEAGGRHTRDPRRLNMAYFLFFFHLYYFLFTILAFWTDIIPGLGTIPDGELGIFAKRLWFNMGCLFGKNGCHASVYLLGWGAAMANLLGNACIAYLIRYSEGATYMVVAKTLRSPLMFLFWTLFVQFPGFHWGPHASLSTWLSISALVIMVPAILLYNTGPDENQLHQRSVLSSSHFTDTNTDNMDSLECYDTVPSEQSRLL